MRRAQLPACSATHDQQANYRHRDQHVDGRIGEVDGLIADLADFEEVVDIELVNRIKGHARFHCRAAEPLGEFGFGEREVTRVKLHHSRLANHKSERLT